MWHEKVRQERDESDWWPGLPIASLGFRAIHILVPERWRRWSYVRHFRGVFDVRPNRHSLMPTKPNQARHANRASVFRSMIDGRLRALFCAPPTSTGRVGALVRS